MINRTASIRARLLSLAKNEGIDIQLIIILFKPTVCKIEICRQFAKKQRVYFP